MAKRSHPSSQLNVAHASLHQIDAPKCVKRLHEGLSKSLSESGSPSPYTIPNSYKGPLLLSPTNPTNRSLVAAALHYCFRSFFHLQPNPFPTSSPSSPSQRLHCVKHLHYGSIAFTGYDPSIWRLCGWSWQPKGANYRKEHCARKGAFPPFPFMNGALELLSAPLGEALNTRPASLSCLPPSLPSLL